MLLKRMKIKWNRGKLKVTSPDPLYTVKQERVDTPKKSPDGNVKMNFRSHDALDSDKKLPAKYVFRGCQYFSSLC